MAKKCDELTEKENEMYKKLKQIEHNKSITTQNIQTLKLSLNSCLSVMKLYNDFMDNNNEYIDKINSDFRSQWNHFEQNWMKWDTKDVMTWFKYKTIGMATEDIKWQEVEEQLSSRNISGKSLSKFNDLTFDLIGIKGFEIVNHIITNIEKLNIKSLEIPDRFICPITKKIMKEPVMAFDGYCYEKMSIESYLKINKKSFVTGENADYIGVFPNHSLKKEITKFIKDNNIDIDTLNVNEHNDGETNFID